MDNEFCFERADLAILIHILVTNELDYYNTLSRAFPKYSSRIPLWMNGNTAEFI